MGKTFLVFVFVIVLLVSCSTLRTYRVAELVLDENPTTGYRWEFVTDENILSLRTDVFKPQKTKLLGAGGKRVFTFDVLKEEDTLVYLYYRRSWETFPEKPDMVYSYSAETGELKQLI